MSAFQFQCKHKKPSVLISGGQSQTGTNLQRTGQASTGGLEPRGGGPAAAVQWWAAEPD